MNQIHWKKVSQKLSELSHSFCLAKWNQSTIYLYSGYTHSCHHPASHKIDRKALLKNPSAMHNTAHKRKVREQMLSGKRPPECNYCWKFEASAAEQPSDRILKSGAEWSMADLERIHEDEFLQNPAPSYLEVAFSNVCNFKCAYCLGVTSSTWMAELQKFGPYPTISDFTHPSFLKKRAPLPSSHLENPYTNAFWRWWPELKKSLRVFRMTGGEPLLSPDTFKLLKSIYDEPMPELTVAVNSNMGVPKKMIDSFIEISSSLVRERKVKKLELFASIDTAGAQAEYLRFGLVFSQFCANIERTLEQIPDLHLTFMNCFNVLSPFQFVELLRWIYALKRKYKNVFLDLSMLQEPAYLSCQLMPETCRFYLLEAISFMDGKEEFSPSEKAKISRLIELLEKAPDPSTLMFQKVDFVRFFREYDKRRGTNLLAVFPQLESLWKEGEILEKDLPLLLSKS